MSRHTTKIDHYEIAVGWDQPLQTYFGQIYDLNLPEDKQIVFWEGTIPRRFYEIEDLARAMAKEMPEARDFVRSLERELYQDKDEGL